MTFVLTGLDIEAKAELVRRPAGGRADRQARRAGVDAGPHRPPRRRHRGGRQRAAALRGPRPRPGERRPPVLLGRSRIGVGQLSRVSPSPRRPATVRSTACSPPATSTPPRCRTSRCTPTAPASRSPAPPTLWSWQPADAPPLPEPLPAGPTRRAPLGRIAGARSGDKGGVGQRRGLGAHRRAVALAGQHADRRAAQASCFPRPPICRSPGTCCPTCAR